MADGIVSSSIVGYATQATDSKAYQTSGSMFVSVGGDGTTWKLGDLKMVIDGKDGGAYQENMIQFIEPTSSVIDRDKIYTYYGTEDDAVAGEDDGWYTFPDDDYVNDQTFVAGTAFLCNFKPKYNASLTYAGQVLTGDVTIDTVVDGTARAYMYIVNPIPTQITLGDIKMVINGKDGGAYQENMIQFIDPSTSVIDRDKIYTYYGTEDDAVEGEDDGWYTFPDDDYVNNTPVAVGAGFLCNFKTKYAAKLVFKNPVK